MLFPLTPPLAPISGSSSRFPIGRIFCVARNYADHARELGNDDRTPPFLFTKSANAFAPDGSTIPYPPLTQDLHHEAELVIALHKPGFDVAPEAALDLVYGYATGLDMARRDLQAEAQRGGKPWDMAKNFEGAAPLGQIHSVERTGHVASGAITLTINGHERQRGDLADMVWSPAEIISQISRYGRLLPGDLIYTGTPSGVGPVERGDRLTVSIAGLSDLSVTFG